MRTRIDHATVITCQANEPVVLPDHSVEFRDGVITSVGPTEQLRRPATAHPLNCDSPQGPPARGHSPGSGPRHARSDPAGPRSQRISHGVIGQQLVQMGYISEADVEHALAVQSGNSSRTAPSENSTVIDGRDCLVIPGLVNTHHHLFQSLTRCLPAVQNACLFDWLVGLYPSWQHLDYDALRQAAMVSIAELLLGGCTTTSDHMYLFPPGSDVAAEAVLEAAETLGIRIHVCRGQHDPRTLGRRPAARRMRGGRRAGPCRLASG